MKKVRLLQTMLLLGMILMYSLLVYGLGEDEPIESTGDEGYSISEEYTTYLQPYVVSSTKEIHKSSIGDLKNTEVIDEVEEQPKEEPEFVIELVEYIEPECVIYDIDLAEEYQEYAYDLCQKENISYELFLALMKLESNFNIKQKTPNKSKGKVWSYDRGLTQINTTYQDFYAELAGIKPSKFDPYNPYHSIKAGIYGLVYYRDYWFDEGITDQETLWYYMLNSYNKGHINYQINYVEEYGRLSFNYDKRIFEYKAQLEQIGKFE